MGRLCYNQVTERYPLEAKGYGKTSVGSTATEDASNGLLLLFRLFSGMLALVSQRWRVLILASCCLCAICAAWMLGRREPEPGYQGQSLSQLIELSDRYYGSRDPYTRTQAVEAIRHIGTNAIPFLLKWIQFEEPPWETKLRFRIWILTGKRVNAVKPISRADEAVYAFHSLDQDADGAVGELARLMNLAESEHIRSRAAFALGYMARPKALLPLLEVITNSQSSIRLDAVSALQHFGTNAQPALPLLIECLKDKDEMVAKEAAWSLGELKLEPDLVVPALISNAKTNRPILFNFVVDALEKYGTSARSAVPLLLEALRSKDESMRNNATNALTQIAPEFLTNAPSN